MRTMSTLSTIRGGVGACPRRALSVATAGLVVGNIWEIYGKNGKMGVSGRICLYVACYDIMLLFNVCSLVLMIYWDIVRGGLGS